MRWVLLTLVGALLLSGCTSQPTTPGTPGVSQSPQATIKVDSDKLIRFVTRFLDVTIGPNDKGTRYLMVADAPQDISSRLPKGSDIVGTEVDPTRSEALALVDVPLVRSDVTAHFRDILKRDGWEEKSFNLGAPSADAGAGPFLFCAKDASLLVIAYDPSTPRVGYTTTLVTTVAAGAAGSPCTAPAGGVTPGPEATQLAGATTTPTTGATPAP